MRYQLITNMDEYGMIRTAVRVLAEFEDFEAAWAVLMSNQRTGGTMFVRDTANGRVTGFNP